MNQFEDQYTINKGKFKFTIRPEEKAGLARRLKEDPIFRDTVFGNKENKKIDASIEYSVTKQSNSIVKAFGIPESGKSTILKIIGYQIYQEVKGNGMNPKLQVTFNYPDTIHKIRDYFKGERKEGDVLIVQQDEQNELQGAESRAYQTQIDNLLKTFRAAQVFVLLASPDDTDLSVCNMKIEAIAKDLDQKINWGVLYVPSREKLKLKFKPIGSIFLEYTKEIDEFYRTIINYEEHKMNYILEVIDRRGLQTISLPADVIEEGVSKIMEEAIRSKLKTKEAVKSLASTMGLGTSNTTKYLAEVAALRFEAHLEEEREKIAARELLEKIRLEKEEEKRISRLVIKVAKELYNTFSLLELKAASRIITGYIIENYPDDWQHLIRHKRYFWSLAEYWQHSSLPKLEEGENSFELGSTSSDRELLRIAFIEAVKMRKYDKKLSERVGWNLIPDLDPDDWTISAQAKAAGISTGTLSTYLKRHQPKITEIKKNEKIWGDAGEIYLKYKVQKLWEKGQKSFDISSDATLVLSCAAHEKSSLKGEKSTSLYDLEIIINGKSVAAVNIKFTHHENRGYRVEPECNHENPFLFVIDKSTFNEILVSSESGKQYRYINGGERALNMAEWLYNLNEPIS